MKHTLKSLNPTEAWQPADDSVWDLKWAAHLYRRAAFGAPRFEADVSTWETLQQAVDRGRNDCIDRLLTGGEQTSEFNTLMDALGERIARRKAPRFQGTQPERLQGWWLYRMAWTPHPLLERLTLFWHDHFATSLSKVADQFLMFQQNKLLREHALGRFKPLLSGIAHDPAMTLWLDGNSNIKGAPNENFAREIMELFSLGVGNYTEKDIQEAARAFTGWGSAGENFLFNAALHDEGEKTVLGTTGNLNGDEVVEILLKQPACARFLARKLFAEFVSESEEPPEALIEPLAKQLRDTDYDLHKCVETILRSRVFFSEHAYRKRIKSPIEYTLGLVRSIDARFPMENLAELMDGLGQTLFAPPNVAGWDGGKAWLNSATLVARHNLAANMTASVESINDDASRKQIDPVGLIKKHGGEDLRAQAAFLLKLFLQNDVSDATRAKVNEFAASGDPKNAEREQRAREIAHTILVTPEYQLA